MSARAVDERGAVAEKDFRILPEARRTLWRKAVAALGEKTTLNVGSVAIVFGAFAVVGALVWGAARMSLATEENTSATRALTNRFDAMTERITIIERAIVTRQQIEEIVDFRVARAMKDEKRGQ